MTFVCAPLDLGGRTVEEPCPGVFGFCTSFDYFNARRLMQTERNGLVARLNAFAALVNQGRATVTPATSVALTLANETSWQLLEDYGDSKWNHLGFEHQLREGTRLFVDMVIRLHAASCDVDAAIVAAGATAPSVPEPPPPPQGIVDNLAEGLGKVAGGALKVGAVAVGLWAAAQFLRSRQGGRGGEGT